MGLPPVDSRMDRLPLDRDDLPAPETADLGASDLVERTREGLRDGVDGLRGTTGGLLGAARAEAGRVLSDADPEEVALWGICGGVALATPAVAAATSTTLLLGGAVAGSSAVGAYASATPDSAVARVDPTEFAGAARLGATQGRGIGARGESLGALLGAGTAVAGDVLPAEYAQWVDRVDLESVLRGAALGAERAGDGARGATLLGGGVGLLYGYVEDAEALDAATGGDDLEALLDEDLFEQLQRRT